MHLENNLKNGIDELVENQEEVIEALKGADHFYICHYCKKTRANRTQKMLLGRQV